MIVDSHLEMLEASGLIYAAQDDPDVEYAFQHTLLQEAVYGSLLKEDRMRLHRLAGETLEQLYPDRSASADLAPVLGRHFAEAGDEQRAVKYFTLAADMAAGLYANQEAVTHYSQAIEIMRRRVEATTDELIHLYTQCGRALELSARYEPALAIYREMETLAGERGDRRLALSALMAQATLFATYTPVYDPQQGQELSERALALAHDLADRQAEAKVLWVFMLLYQSLERSRQAVEYGERSLALAREFNLREQLAFTLNDIQYAYLSLGRLAQGREVLEEARALWREMGNMPMLTDNLSRSALICYLSGNYERAVRAAEEAYRISRLINNAWGQGFSRFVVGPIYMEQGRLGQAIAIMEETLAFVRGSDFQSPFILAVQADLAWLYGVLGDVDRGLELLQAGLASLDDTETTQTSFRSLLLAVLARLELLQGNVAAAEAAFEEGAAAPNEEQPLSFTLVWIELARGELALAKQSYGPALDGLDEFIDRSYRLEIRFYRPEALHLKSLALLGLNRTAEALETLAAARDEAEQLGARRVLWPILLSLSQIKAQQGQTNAAEAARQTARTIVEEMAATIDQPDLRAAFLSLPEARAVLY